MKLRFFLNKILKSLSTKLSADWFKQKYNVIEDKYKFVCLIPRGTNSDFFTLK